MRALLLALLAASGAEPPKLIRHARFEVLGWSAHGSVAAVHAVISQPTRLGDEVLQEQVVLVGEADESFARVFTLQAPRGEGRPKLDTGAAVDAALADMGIAPLRAQHPTPQTCAVATWGESPLPLYCSPNGKLALFIDTAATELWGSYVQQDSSELVKRYTGTFRLFDSSPDGLFRTRPIRLDAWPAPRVVPLEVWLAVGLIALSLVIWLLATRRKAS